jgi:signal transduction histidine kinase
MATPAAGTYSKTIISIGFTAIVLALVVLLCVWVINVYNNETILNDIANTQLETRQIAVMRNAAYRRALALHRMSIMSDPFEQEEEERRFRELGGIFLSTRDKLLMRPMMGEEKRAWDHVRTTLNKGGRAQNEVLELILDEKLAAANNLLLHDVVPTQDIFVAAISDILDKQRDRVESKISDVTQRNHTTYWLIGLFASVALSRGICTIFVVRRTGKTEAALLKQGKRIRELYKVSSMAGLDIDEQISQMLKLGSRMLDMEIAKVCKVDSQKDTSCCLYLQAPDNFSKTHQKVLALKETLCRLTFPAQHAIAIHDVKHSPHNTITVKKNNDIQSYIGANLNVRGETFGTLSFSSLSPRLTSFTDTDKDLVHLISNWVSLSLERQISASELFQAKENAESANNTKSTFLANMSHELRTPLNAIIGYSELLISDLDENDDQQKISDLNNISQSGHHLLRLINDILDISKIEAGKMELSLETTNISNLIDETVESFRPSLIKNNDTLNVYTQENLSDALVDPLRLKQVLLNLFSNAVKFTENGTITVTTEQTNLTDKGWVVIQVTDTGIGMEKNEIATLFQPFQQTSAVAGTQYGGTGLGLAISRRICRLMGGDIQLKSTKGKGSTFSIWLPLDPEHTIPKPRLVIAATQ